MTFGMPALVVYAATFIVVVAMVPIANGVALRLRAVATPRADRWNHRVVPTLGGIAIFSGVVVATILLPLSTVDRMAVLVGVATMFAVGLADDLRHISAMRRLAMEGLVGGAFVAVVSDGLTPELRVAAVILGVVAVPVAVNATNLTDNADGLAATLSIATAGTLVIATGLSDLQSVNASIAAAVGVAALAFLLFNRPPARVFMGDCGSLVLGFGLAAASVLIVRDALLIPGTTHVATAMAIPVAWAFQVGDLGMVVVTRMRRGASPFSGGVDHTSHRLLAAGIRPWLLLTGLGVLAAVVGSAAALAAAVFGGFVLMAVVAVSLLIMVALFETAVAWRLPAESTTRGQPASSPAPSPLHVDRPKVRG